MKTFYTIAVVLLVSLCFVQTAIARPGGVGSDVQASIEQAEAAAKGKVSFMENKGQWPAHVLYRADVPGAQMLATPQGMLVGKFDPQSMVERAEYLHKEEDYQRGEITQQELGEEKFLRGHGWRFNFLGGNSATKTSIERKGESSDYYNFLIGDASQHATYVRSYSEITYKNVYQGIDVRYYTTPYGDFENDIIVAPGADFNKVKLQIEGIEGLYVNDKGEIVFNTSVGEQTIPAPISYIEDRKGKRTSVDVKFALEGKNTIAFIVPKYDVSQTLVIDPIVMRWATLISGNSSGDAHFHGIDVDASGYIYAIGRYDNNLVTVGAFQASNGGGTDLFISKYQEPTTPNLSGTRVWQTYLGNSGTDNPYAITLGLDGYPYICGGSGGSMVTTYGTGFTSSWTNRGSNSTFIARVHPNGTGAAVRTLGPSSGSAWGTLFYDIRVLPTTGNNFDLIAVGSVNQQSSSSDGDIPQATQPNGNNVTNTGHNNGYAVRITSNLSTLVWTKQFTSSGANSDRFNICVVDNANNILVGGFTQGNGGISYNNPSGQTSRVGTQDGWLLRLDAANGNSLWSRYFNASSNNTASILCMETNRLKTQVIIGGRTQGALSNVNTTAGAYAQSYLGGTADLFVASLPINGSATTWGTYFGGNGDEINMMGLNVDQNDDIYVLGYSNSKNVPTFDNPLQTNTYDTDDDDALFFKLSANGANLLYSTYIGGTDDETDPVGQRGIKFADCRIYLPITTYSTNFPLTQNTLTTTKSSSNTIGEPALISMANPPDLIGNSITGGADQTITCGNAPSPITASVPSYVFASVIRSSLPQVAGTSGAYPNGLPVISSYQWQSSADSGSTWVNIAGATNQNYTPPAITVNGMTMYRRIINGDACNRASDTLAVVRIIVTPSVATPIVTNNGPLCVGQNLQLTASSTTPNVTYSWTGPNGFSSSLQNPTINNVTTANAGTYSVIATSQNGCKSLVATTTLVVNTIPSAPTASSNSPVCAGGTLNLTATSTGTFNWTGPNGFASTLQNPSITNVTTAAGGTYNVTRTVDGCTSPAGSVFVTITFIPAPTNPTATPNPVCVGNTVTFNVSGQGGATYSWTGPQGFAASVQNPTRSITATNMGGTYSVTQTASGCTSLPATVNLVVNANPAITAASGTNPTTCSGTQGTITLSGLTAGQQYTLNYLRNGAGQTPQSLTANGSGQLILTGLNAGSYTNFTVTQVSTGCSSPAFAGPVILSDPTTPSAPSITTNSPICVGDTLRLSTPTVAGVTYNWSGPGGFTSNLQNPTRPNALSTYSGTYSLNISINNCTSPTSTATVVVGTPPTASVSSVATSCTGQCNGSATVNITGGQSPYTIRWSTGATTATISNLCAGTYFVVVSDANNCRLDTIYTSVANGPSPEISLTTTNVFCLGDNSGTSTVNHISGVAPYTYAWSNGGTTQTITNLAIGSYTVTVTDSRGCSVVSTTSITEYSTLVVAVNTTQANGGNNGAAIAQAYGGLPPYSYLWSTGSTSQTITGLAVGAYSITVTDAEGNFTVEVVQITSNATIATGSFIINMGITPQTINNGLKPYGLIYQLVRNNNVPVKWVINPSKAKDGIDFSHNGIDYRSGAFVVEAQYRTPAVNALISSWQSQGVVGATTVSQLTLPVYATITTFSNLVVDQQNEQLVTPYFANAAIPSSIYTVGLPSSLGPCDDTYALPHADPTWANHSNLLTFNTVNRGFIWAGCHAVSALEGIFNPLNAAQRMNFLSTTGLQCYNGNGCGSLITETHDDPNTPYAYDPAYNSDPVMQFMGDLTPSTENGSEQMYIPLTTGAWRPTTAPAITTADGAAPRKGVKVAYGPGFGNTNYGYVMYEAGHTSTGRGPVTAQVAFQRAFFNFILLAGTQKQLLINANIPTTFISGTPQSASVSVTGGSPPYTYSWSSACGATFSNASSATTNITFPSLAPQTKCFVTCVVQDACGRRNFVSVPISSITPPPPAYRITVNGVVDASCFGVCDGQVNISTSGGTPPYTFQWSNGATTEDLTGLCAGEYRLTVVDINGCRKLDTFTITQPPLVASTVASSNSPVCTGDTLKLFATAAPGASYSWSGPAGFSSTLQNPTRANAILGYAGIYSVYTYVGACTSAVSNTTVLVNQRPSISNAVGANPTTCGGSQGTITLTSFTSGAQYSVAYQRNSVAQTPVTLTANVSGELIITGLNAGSYSNFVATLVSTGCASAAYPGPVNLSDPNPPTAPIATSNSPVCSGDTIKLFASTIVGATYTWTGPSAFSSTLQNPIRLNATTGFTGSYSVVATVNNCNSPSASVNVVVNQRPSISTASGSNPSTCGGSQGSITLSGLTASAQYSVTYQRNTVAQGPIALTANASGQVIIPGLNAGSYTNFIVTLVSTGCASATFPGPVTLSDPNNPNPPTLTGNTPLCYGDTLKVSASTIAGATYAWTGPGGFVASTQNVVRPDAVPTMSGTYSVVVTVDNCNSAPATRTITVTSCPPVAVKDSFTVTEDNLLVINVPGVLVNDYDPANPQQPLTVTTTPVCNVKNGSLNLINNGSFTYQPNLNFNGLDTFCYRICDNEVPAACDTAIVVIRVIPQNDPPRIPDTTVTTPEDTPITVCLPVTDPESFDLHGVTVCQSPQNGTLSALNVNNPTLPRRVCLTYTPNTNFHGIDSLCLIVCDNGIPVGCDTSIVRIIITPVNDPPIAVNDFYTGIQDQPINDNILVNDSDPDGDLITATTTPIIPPSNGNVVIQPNGDFIYTPNLLFNGSDTFFYRICDNGSPVLCDTARVVLSLDNVNDPPIAVDDYFNCAEDSTITANVLPNDVDPDGDNLIVSTTAVTNPINGIVTNITANGFFTYTPNANFNGVDSFDYRVCDDGSPVLCDTATVYITVLPRNDKPYIPDTTVTTPEDTPITVCVPITDVDVTDQHSVVICGSPLNGTISSPVVNNSSNPHRFCLTYTPNTNFNGRDSLCVIVCDNGVPTLCDTGKIVIIVTPVNDPPVAVNDFYTTQEDVPVPGNVRSNDSDPDFGDTLTVNTTPVQAPAHGGVVIASNGSFTYTPAQDYVGSDSFRYQVCDRGIPAPVLCDTATAYITISPVNDPPRIPDTTVTTPEDTPITVCLPITDPELADQLHFALVCGNPVHGVINSPVVNNPFQPRAVCVTYTPNPNFNGTDSFCVIVCDNGSPFKCDTGIVTIIVTPVNDPPIAVNDNYTTQEDVPVPGNVRNNDTDPDLIYGDSLTVNPTPVQAPVNGAVVISTNGSFVYTPGSNFNGVDSFRYQVCDRGVPAPVLCDTATVFIVITPVNDPPVAVNDTVTALTNIPSNIVVITNDYDTDGVIVPSTTAVVDSPAQGTVVNNGNGTITYTSVYGYEGVDSFRYRICDNGTPVLCDTATVYITVNQRTVNATATPFCDNDVPKISYNLVSNSPQPSDRISIHWYDLSNNLIATYDSLLPSGTVNWPGAVTDVNGNGIDWPGWVYNGTAWAQGADGFEGLVPQARIVFKLNPTDTLLINYPPSSPFCFTSPPPGPTAVNDTVSTPEDTPIDIAVLNNDYDNKYGLDSTSLAVVTTPPNGTVAINPNRTITYTPDSNFVGIDTFTYAICNKAVFTLCDTATVYITVVPTNDPPEVPDTTVTTCEDCPIDVCIPITDIDNTDIHDVSICGLPNHGTITTGPIVNNGVQPHQVCYTYTPNRNFYGKDTLCLIVCDNGNPVLCDTSYTYITVDPVNDPPYADTVRVVTRTNIPVPVNTSSATGDPDGDPLTYTYETPSVPGTTVTVTGTGAIIVTPPTGFNGVITIPYSVCDVAMYPVTPLCDSAVIIVTVIPGGDTLFNRPPVANNDFSVTDKNTPAVIVVKSNDFDPDGDSLSVQVISVPTHGGVAVNLNGTITYTPNTGYVGFDTFYYEVCDPFGTTLPRPLCDQAMVVVFINDKPNTDENNPPVAVDDIRFICSGNSTDINLLLNDSDPDGDAINVLSIIDAPNSGVANQLYFGGYRYTPANGFFGVDTFTYRICDAGTPSKCDTANVYVYVNATPVITAVPPAVTICSGDTFDITINATAPSVVTWTATNGTSGTGNVRTTLVNNGLNDIVVNYTFRALAPGGCYSNTVTVPVTVKPRPAVFTNPSANQVCHGEPVVIVMASNYVGVTFGWTTNTGKSGNGLFIIDTLTNTGVIDSTVTYNITPYLNGCPGEPSRVNVVVKPRPDVTLVVADDSVCNGQQVVINATSNLPGTTFSWNNSLGQSGSSVPVLNTPLNGTSSPLNIFYTINSFNGVCAGTPKQAQVLVFPPVAADAGADKTTPACAGAQVTLGGSPAAIGSGTPFTYRWSPTANLNDSLAANPTATGLFTTTNFTLTVTDVYGCTATDLVNVTVTPSTLTAEAGNGGGYCFGPGGFVQLGGLPTAVGGQPPYTYTWSPLTALTNPSSSNPLAQPTGTTKYFVTVTDANGCSAVDSVTITVRTAPTVNAGRDTSICRGFSVQLNAVVSGGQAPYSYSWTPPFGLSGFTIPNPVSTPDITTYYQVTVTDANGCTVVDDIQVTVRENPLADAGSDQTLVQCGGDSVQIGGTQLFTQGATPFKYKWTPATGLSSDTILNPWVKGITSDIIYTLVVTDSTGCTGTDNVLVRSLPNNLTAEAGNGGSICAGAGSSVQLGGTPTASGGTPVYTYRWFPTTGLNDSTIANPLASPLVATTYYVTVTDAKGCTAVDSARVSVGGAITVDAGRDTALCVGFAVRLGADTVARGGTAPYSYNWTPALGLSQNNVANPIATPNITTNYTLVVRDANGCTGTDIINVVVNQRPVADAGQDRTHFQCFGDSVQLGGTPTGSGGTPFVDQVGGFSYYNYQWSPNLYFASSSNTTQSNPYLNGFAPTTQYTVTVTDANGCTATDVVLITGTPSSLQANSGPAVIEFCFGDQSQITLGGNPTATGGTGPYFYSWNPSTFMVLGNTGPNPIIEPQGPAIYGLTVIDAKGCIATDTTILAVLPPPFVELGENRAICAGTSTQIGTFPIPFHTYAWSPGTGLSSTTTPSTIAGPTSTTTYTVTVTSPKGCSAVDAVTITVNQNPVANAGVDLSLAACSSDSVQLGGSPAATGGQSPYVYSWTPSTGLNDDSIPNPFVKNIGSTTTYTLEVTDAFGCKGTDQVLVTVVQSNLTAEAGNNAAYCKGSGTQVTLGGTPTASGGVPPLTYTWFPTTGLNLGNISNPIASPDTTTTYTVVITDSRGCQASDTVRITVFERPIVNAGADTTLCFNTPVRLGGTPTVSGGRAPYTINWTPTNVVPVNGANPTAFPTGTTTYIVSVTDANGCSATDNVVVSVAPQLTASAGTNRTVTSCSGDSVTIGGSPTATGGTGAYTYAWSPSANLSSATVANPVVKNLTTSTIFTVTVTDALGCTATAIVTVQVVPSTLQANAGNDTTLCFDPLALAPIRIGGFPTATGGTSPYIYSWAPAAGLNDSSSSNPLASPASTTTYQLLITDAKGCTARDSVKVSINPQVTVALGSDTAICAGDTVRLGGTPATGGGGTAPYTYLWNPTTNMLGATTSNPLVFPTTTTIYAVQVRDVKGCTAVGYQQVFVNSNPFADAGPDKSLVNCAGATISIGGSPAASGGGGVFDYDWTPAVALNNPSVSNPSVNGLTVDTTYVLIVTDQFGCTARDEVRIDVTPSTLTAEAGNGRTVCTGDTTGFQIGGVPTAVGGAAPYSYSWAPANGTLSSLTVANPVAKPLSTTVYYVTVTDANGCTATDSVTIIVSQRPFVEAGLDTSICNGSAYRLGGSPTVAGGLAPYTYSWSPVLGNVANPVVTPVSSVIYGLTVTDANGCSATDFVSVTVRPRPSANAGQDQTIVACSSDSVIIGGSPSGSGGNPPYSYIWFPPTSLNSDTVANPIVKNLGLSQRYTLVVTDQFGCTATDEVFVNSIPNTVFVEGGNGGAICAGTGSTIQLGGNPTAQGGVFPYTFQWLPNTGFVTSNTIANPIVSPTVTTTYTVIVTDGNGCQGSDTVTVVVNERPTIDFTVDSTYCASISSVALTGTPAGGIFSGSGVIGNSFFPSLVGTGVFSINYFYTDGFGCSNTVSKNVRVVPTPIVTITGGNPTYCSNDPGVTLVGTPAGGTFSGPGYSTANGQFIPRNANIGQNRIVYTYTDPNGCTDSAVTIITVYPSPSLTITANNDTICQGQSVVITPVFSGNVFNVQWYDINGTYIQSSLNAITVNPTRMDHGYIAIATSIPNNCTTIDTVFVHVNQSPNAGDDFIETCEDEVAFWDVVANDSDPEGDDNFIAVNAIPSNGTAVVLPGGVIRYTPFPNFNGSDSFTYTICNTQCVNDCDTASILVSVCSVNDTPTITIVIDSIPEDSFIVICPPVFDADTDNLVVTPYICGAIHGTIASVTDSCFVYTPDTNWYGTDTICTVVCDPHGACDSNIVIIIVEPRNEPPVADTIRVVTRKDVPIPVNVTAATFDPNGDPMDYTYGTPSVPGTIVTVTTNGGVVIAPPAGFVGVITIPYVVCDNAQYPVTPLCDTSVIIVTVIDTTTGGQNNPPVANNDYASTPINIAVTVNVFANDFDPDGDPISVVTIIDLPNNGTVTGISGGNVGYQPNQGFEGCDTFTYVITDARGGFDTADVVVCIVDNPSYVNNPPTAVNDYDTVPRNSSVIIPVVNNDNDPDGNLITVQPTLPCAPLRGTVVVNANNTVTYTPGPLANALQPDTFCYAICDNGNPSLCDTAVVVVYTPNSVVAENDDTITGLNRPVVIDIYNNDYDPENDSFCLQQIVAQPLFGTLSYTYINGDSCRPVVTYTPDSNFVGNDGFCYSVVDQWGAVDTACVSIDVIICLPPQVIGDSVFLYQGTDTVVAVLDNDIDYGASLTVTIEQAPFNGTATVIGDSIVYVPNPGFSGNDYLIYRAEGLCGSDTAYVSFTILPICTPVKAYNDYGLTMENTPIGISVLINDQNTNPLPLNASLMKGPKNGTATISGNVVTYTPDSGFTGLDTMKYIACTRCGSTTLCDSALVIIQVDTTPCPLPIVAVNDVITVGYNCQGGHDIITNDTNFIGTNVTIIDSANLGNSFINVRTGQLVYIPGGQATSGQTDTVKYAICNACGVCDTGTILIKITGFPCNGQYPVANPDTFKVCRNSVTDLYPLGNDYDPDGGILSLDTFTLPSHGSAIQVGNVVRYVPQTDFLGTDFIYYTVCDDGIPTLCQSAGMVIVIDSCVNHPPSSDPEVVYDTTYVNTPNTTCVAFTDPDGDLVNVTGVYGVEHGTVTYNGTTNCFEYTPSTGYIGNDTFSVIVCDNSPYGTLCDTATVIYTVLPIPDGQNPPVAVNDVAGTDSATAVVIGIIFNDYDLDGDSISICTVPLTAPLHGAVTNNNDGTVTYTPSVGFVGVDSFTYVLCDNGTPSLSDTAKVFVYVGVKPPVTGTNEACDQDSTTNSTPVTLNVLANDILPLANDTIVTISASPLNGSADVNGDNTITYVPNDEFAGIDNFTYSVCVRVGSQIACDTATVCITVIDTTVDCVFPNGFSPNGDGVNDLFLVNCNEEFPEATLRVFNRWGDEVWYSKGHYQNDWNGKNILGENVPDGTYFYIYEYSDGSNRKEARFVVIHR